MGRDEAREGEDHRALSLLRTPLGETPVILEAKTQSDFRRVKKGHMTHAYTDHIARLSCCRQVAI